MRTSEINKLLNFVQQLPASPEGEEAAAAIMRLAADSITLESLKDRGLADTGDQTTLEFTIKEISQMPKTFRREFRTDGCTAHVRKRRSGRNSWNYEIRYRRGKGRETHLGIFRADDVPCVCALPL